MDIDDLIFESEYDGRNTAQNKTWIIHKSIILFYIGS